MKPPRNREDVLRLAKRLYGHQARIHHWLIGEKFPVWEIRAYNDAIMSTRSTLCGLGLALHQDWERQQARKKWGAAA
jgi:hypothetical protein